MSLSSLSPPPESEPNLPVLRSPRVYTEPLGLGLPCSNARRQPRLPESDSELFKARLFSRTLLETNPPTIQVRCLQPGCSYTPKPQGLLVKQTSNYWTHYYNVHPAIASVYRPDHNKISGSQSSSHATSVATLFTPRISKLQALTLKTF